MQQRERKGAWVLFMTILLFGAAVFGYGYYKRKAIEKTALELSASPSSGDDMRNRETTMSSDSIKMFERSGKEKKKRKSGRKNSDKKEYRMRDILADSIPVR